MRQIFSIYVLIVVEILFFTLQTMNKQVLQAATYELKYQKKLQSTFTKQLKKETPGISNTHYLKLLSKLSQIDNEILALKSVIKQSRRQNFFTNPAVFSKKFFVTMRDKVKLVSVDFQIVLWLDAKNTSELLGKRLGEMINLYDSRFKIAGIY